MMKGETGAPIEIDFKSVGPEYVKFDESEFKTFFSNVSKGNLGGYETGSKSLRTFTSYSFDKNILVPASAFRFTAPGVDKDTRTAIRSGDMVELFAVNSKNEKIQIATGFVDETDTHIGENSIEYVITGRDTIGQLIDNSAVDKDNEVIHVTKWTIENIMDWILKNTRLNPKFIPSGILPNADLIFRINPGETKINTLQRYFEFLNCLIWASPTGQVVVGKPDFNVPQSGKLIVDRTDPKSNNVIEARVRRNVNTAIRQIVTVLQAGENIRVAPFTIKNNDQDVKARASSLVGRSVMKTFQYTGGENLINVIQHVGKSGSPFDIGSALSFRDIARDNMKVLDVEVVLKGHTNENDLPYDINQIYDVKITDDNLHEGMYVYSCTYNLTPDHGIMTTLRLCRLHTIVAYTEQLRGH